MRHSMTCFSTALLLLAALNFTHANSNTKPPEIDNKNTAADPKAIESYWTEEKMRSAKPMRAEKLIPYPEKGQSQPKPPPALDKNKIE